MKSTGKTTYMHQESCCFGPWTWKRRFPTFAVVVLVIGVLWLLNDLHVFSINIPWWPVILIVVAIGWIVNNYTKR